jgi:hypothetical protein
VCNVFTGHFFGLTLQLERFVKELKISFRVSDHGLGTLGLDGTLKTEIRTRLDPQVRTWYSMAVRTSSTVS